MERAGIAKLRRNLAVALGNAVGTMAAPTTSTATTNPARPTIRTPLVAAHVAWARRN